MLFLIAFLCAAALQLQTPTPGTPSAASAATPSSSAPIARAKVPLTAKEISDLQEKATAGDTTAQLRLARAYDTGDGVSEDQEKATEWCRKAASQGNAEAQNLLGIRYLQGQGVATDKNQALAWFHKAAFQGNGDAMFNLGAAYYNGDAVGRDETISYAWFLLAKQAGSLPSVAAVQRAEATLQFSDVTDSFKAISRMYDAGVDLPKNENDAATWLLKAAARGDQDAELGMADRFLNGQGVKQDFSEARVWCNRASQQGDSGGYYCTGLLYQRGLGVERDPKEARKWYQRSAALRNRFATAALAQMDLDGEGGKPDRVAACLLYAQLIAMGDAPSIKTLAVLKGKMSAKEWKKVEQHLPAVRIDPKKLDALLQKEGAN